MRMDHHCPWTGNCIGLNNNKLFICFLFWTFIACLNVFVSSKIMNSKLGMSLKNDNHNFLKANTAIPMSLGVAFGVLLMLLIHRYFLNSNKTTVEVGALAEYNPYRFQKESDNNS